MDSEPAMTAPQELAERLRQRAGLRDRRTDAWGAYLLAGADVSAMLEAADLLLAQQAQLSYNAAIIQELDAAAVKQAEEIAWKDESLMMLREITLLDDDYDEIIGIIDVALAPAPKFIKGL